jgi:protoheme IX farnesyltransferase
VGAGAPVARALGVVRDLVALTKPRITALVLFTEEVGGRLAAGQRPARTHALALLGTALVVAAANTLNMWWEREADGKMERTRHRPLPAGRLSPDIALVFGVALAVLSTPMLFMVNLTTGLLGLVALASYVLVYTPLKRHTYAAVLVGAIPGAIPPLLGWSTVTGGIEIGGALLFAFLFFWQVPHFAAITIFRADDYARAGMQVVSVQRGERAARRMIAIWTVLLVASSLAFVGAGLAGRAYEIVATVLGVAFLALAFRGSRRASLPDAKRWARHVFAFSIPYLTVLLLVLLADRGPS